MNFPSGNVTFLFTDIEGSTKLAQENNEAYLSAFEKHHEILYEVFDTNKGFVFKILGDAFCCAFNDSADAVKAAIESQEKLNSAEWNEVEIRVRMGIHSGKAEWNGSDYSGYVTLARTQRVMSSAYGGQILISSEAFEHFNENNLHNIHTAFSFRDLGERRLKDLIQPVRLFQITSGKLRSEFPPLKTLDARPNNLPIQLTNFIGREKEMTEIKNIFQTTRLLTLLGPGGTGKTRLSLQSSADMIDEFENGVWLVELAALKDPTLIYNEIASVLNLKQDPGRKINEVISDYLKEKKLLLIFDNCEHLINECAVIAQTLLNYCQELKIMTSSRESLRIHGEKIFHVPVLSMPGIEQNNTVESISQFEAVSLFIDRACSVRSDFEVTNDNAPALAQLCYQLDGIPLAIELAAARIKILTVEKILENINNRFQLLTGGSRTALPRQKTLRALIDWSYDLLNEKEKLLFSRLSVFSGGWSMESAEHICSGDELKDLEIIDLLSNLIDKSIVISVEKNGTTRYNMLETIRQYSMEKLVSKNEIYRKHFNYYFKLSIPVDSKENSGKRSVWNRIMEPEQDNLRSAIKWSLENLPEQSAGLLLNFADYLEVMGNFTESFENLKKLLELNSNTDSEIRAAACLNSAYILCQLASEETPENYLDQGLEYFRRTGNNVKTAEGLSIYGIISFIKGDPETAKKYFEEGLMLIEGKDEKLIEANVKGNLAVYYSGIGEAETALKLLDEAITNYKELGYRNLLVKLLISKGGIYFQNGDLEKAGHCFEEGLLIMEEINDMFTYASTLYNLGNLNFAQKNYSKATDFYNTAMSKSKEYGLTNIFDRTLIKTGEIALIQKETVKAKEIFTGCLRKSNKDSERLKIVLSIYGLSNYYFIDKNYELSAKLIFFAERIIEAIKFKFSKTRLEENKNLINELKKKLSEEKLNDIHSEVNSFDLDKAAEIALAMSNE